MIKLLAALWGGLNNNGRGDWSLEKMQYWNNLDAAIRHIQSKKGYQVHFWDREGTMRDPTVKRSLRDTDDFIRKSVWSNVTISLEHGLFDRDRHIYIRTRIVSDRTPLEQYLHGKNPRQPPEPRHVYILLDFMSGLRRFSPFEYEEWIVGWFEKNPLNLDEV